MKIGIDCSAVAGERSGVGQYAYNLVNALAETDAENRYSLYVLFPLTNYILHRNLLKVDLPVRENFNVVFKNIPVPYQLLPYLWVPGLASYLEDYRLGGLDVDIIHSTTYTVPRFRDRKKRLIVTIYDLTFITHPEYHQKLNIQHCLTGTKDAIAYADAIIAISNHTRKDLIELLGVPEEMIRVTPLAADSCFRPVSDAEAMEKVRVRYGLPDRYVLFLGSLEPRKNVLALVRAYANLPAGLREEFSLVIAGTRGWFNSDVNETVKALGLDGKVIFPGYVAREDLAAVYSMAAVFVYPSFYEGFGLPVLEAMSCGTPVITSNTSSMPEVAGDAAVLISPENVSELAERLEYLLKNESEREEMRKNGIRRAAQFSWEKCARQTLEVYEAVAGKQKP